jgi:hypothetical protein
MAKEAMPQSPVVLAVAAAVRESNQAKADRIQQNKENLDCYHMRQDWSHKQRGQSREFLAKVNVASEQFVSFLHQGLVDKGDWFAIENASGVADQARIIAPEDMFKILRNELEKADFYNVAGDSLKMGALQSLMILKIHGCMVPKYRFRTERERTGFFKQNVKTKLLKEERMVWQLKLSLVRPENFHQDPTGRGLYRGEDIEMDWWELKEIASQYPEDYDMGAIESLAHYSDQIQAANRARETGQNTTTERRKTVKITEYWGTLVDPNSGEILHRDIVCAVANDLFVVRPPKPIPLWIGTDPYVAAPIRRVPGSVWHQAVMDAPTKHNRALNEVYNLMLDGGIKSVFGIGQMREDWLEDPSQVADGVAAGDTLKVNSKAPVGGKVYERVDTGTEFTQASAIFSLTDREFNSSGFTSDLRAGTLPDRQVKATEIVSTSQALQGISGGMVKSIEASFMAKVLEKAWGLCAQHMNDFSSEEMKALLGEDKALAIANLSPEDRFAQTAQGHAFRVFGLSTTMNKIQDFQKLQAYLGTVSASPVLLSEFMKTKDLGKFMDEVAKSLGINLDRIRRDGDPSIESGQGDQAPSPDQVAATDQRVQQLMNPNNNGAPPNRQSQIPQVDSSRRTAEQGVNIPRGPIARGGLTNPGG